jgi:predicted nucleotidyltransferase
MTLEESLADNLLEMKLFGSRARGDARKDSDVDVLVIISSGDWRTYDVGLSFFMP